MYWKKKKRNNRIIGLTLEGASKDICSSQKWWTINHPQSDYLLVRQQHPDGWDWGSWLCPKRRICTTQLGQHSFWSCISNSYDITYFEVCKSWNGLDPFILVLAWILCCLTLIGMRQGGFTSLIILGLDFVSWIFIKNFQTFLEVKIEINWDNLTPCQAHWVL